MVEQNFIYQEPTAQQLEDYFNSLDPVDAIEPDYVKLYQAPVDYQAWAEETEQFNYHWLPTTKKP